MSEILDNICILAFLVDSESVLLLAFDKYMLYSHFTVKKSVFFMYFLEAKNSCFVTKNCSESSNIYVFILSKKQHNWQLIYQKPS